jgi:flagellar motor switch protein FliM
MSDSDDDNLEPAPLSWNEGAAEVLGGGGSERILNQDEIDSLLGFDLTEDESNDRTGIRAIINSALVSYERLPMLEIVFDRLVRLMTTSLRNFTSDNVEVSLDNISSIRFGDYLNSIPLPAILSRPCALRAGPTPPSSGCSSSGWSRSCCTTPRPPSSP